jgi:hypothetical protein
MLDKNLCFPTIHNLHIPENLFLYLKTGRAGRAWSPGFPAVKQCRPILRHGKTGRTVPPLEKKRMGGILGQDVQIPDNPFRA